MRMKEHKTAITFNSEPGGKPGRGGPRMRWSGGGLRTLGCRNWRTMNQDSNL